MADQREVLQHLLTEGRKHLNEYRISARRMDGLKSILFMRRDVASQNARQQLQKLCDRLVDSTDHHLAEIEQICNDKEQLLNEQKKMLLTRMNSLTDICSQATDYLQLGHEGRCLGKDCMEVVSHLQEVVYRNNAEKGSKWITDTSATCTNIDEDSMKLEYIPLLPECNLHKSTVGMLKTSYLDPREVEIIKSGNRSRTIALSNGTELKIIVRLNHICSLADMDLIQMKIMDMNSVTIPVKAILSQECKNELELTFVPKLGHSYQVVVRIYGVHVVNSPYRFQVQSPNSKTLGSSSTSFDRGDDDKLVGTCRKDTSETAVNRSDIGPESSCIGPEGNPVRDCNKAQVQPCSGIEVTPGSTGKGCAVSSRSHCNNIDAITGSNCNNIITTPGSNCNSANTNKGSNCNNISNNKGSNCNNANTNKGSNCNNASNNKGSNCNNATANPGSSHAETGTNSSHAETGTNPKFNCTNDTKIYSIADSNPGSNANKSHFNSGSFGKQNSKTYYYESRTWRTQGSNYNKYDKSPGSYHHKSDTSNSNCNTAGTISGSFCNKSVTSPGSFCKMSDTSSGYKSDSSASEFTNSFVSPGSHYNKCDRSTGSYCNKSETQSRSYDNKSDTKPGFYSKKSEASPRSYCNKSDTSSGSHCNKLDTNQGSNCNKSETSSGSSCSKSNTSSGSYCDESNTGSYSRSSNTSPGSYSDRKPGTGLGWYSDTSLGSYSKHPDMTSGSYSSTSDTSPGCCSKKSDTSPSPHPLFVPHPVELNHLADSSSQNVNSDLKTATPWLKERVPSRNRRPTHNLNNPIAHRCSYSTPSVQADGAVDDDTNHLVKMKLEYPVSKEDLWE